MAFGAEGLVMRRGDDLRSALVLSTAFALAAASAVPLLLPSLPLEGRGLPLTLPVFCLALAAQLVVVYGLFVPEGSVGAGLAVGVSALALGAAHAPAFAFLFGGWQGVPLVSWVLLVVLNGLLGVTSGIAFLRAGVVCAVLAHLGTDVVWHTASQLA